VARRGNHDHARRSAILEQLRVSFRATRVCMNVLDRLLVIADDVIE
jgi:hypothetical protein